MAKGNPDNLIPNSERTPEERRENARKAGIASGKARRQKKTLKELAQSLLALDITNQKERQRLEKMGIDPDDMNNAQLMVVGLFRKAAAGDVNAFKQMEQLIGESQDNNGQLRLLIEGLKTQGGEE